MYDNIEEKMIKINPIDILRRHFGDMSIKSLNYNRDIVEILSDKNIYFSIDENKAKELSNQEELSYDNMNDCVITFTSNNKYFNYVLQVDKIEKFIEIRKEFTRFISIKLIEVNDTQSIVVFNLVYVPFDKYYRLVAGLCVDGKMDCSNLVSYNLLNKYDDDYSNCLLCKISRLNKDRCMAYNNPIMSIANAMDIIRYVNKLYNNRRNILRKNSVIKKEYDKVDVSIRDRVETENMTREIPLYDYTTMERRGHLFHSSGYTHSKHNSPRAHKRKAHSRTLKNGKVINIEEITVNKNKINVIYKIK